MWSLLLNEQISDDVKQKLRSFYPKAVTVADILEIDRIDMSVKLGMPLQVVDSLRDSILSTVKNDGVSFGPLLLQDDYPAKFSLGDLSLDSVFGEFFYKHALSLISGPPGVGKTQLLLSAACWCIANNYHVLYLMSDRGVVFDRLLSMMQERRLENTAILSNLHIETVESISDVFEVFERVPTAMDCSWGCVLVDSLTPIVQPYLAFDMNNGRSIITHLFLTLRQIALQWKCPVLTTNQTRKTADGNLKNALHPNIYHFFDYKVDLVQNSEKRLGIIDKSPCFKTPRTFEYSIEGDGIHLA
ncbi:hypothetical protein WA577_001512, partial [Blastocystis sp. JDR]